ncbi:CBS domain-containing protein [Brevundimonas bullata]|jgi:CBS domain-containing protein|uniref:CBS domain-containing protein n=1 Tax=Brevundimonas bullata TaxID=13160 RepID=A0A7W7IQI6_9CAUL|nr:CBS domain-containing protein [Brevundimonas bullata]MBB4798699.1 CBS domain-containing protein [Brevundimonas bullata]MBB6382986.1 CBS domain-containing protein [Brevundimonas bullata]
MLVAEILKGKGQAVFTLSPDASLIEACAELDRKRVGALIVCRGDDVVGVLSERDIVQAIARDGVAALSLAVAHYMTAEVIYAEPTETVAVLMGRMTDRRVRHLPVLLDKRLAGVVSIGDVVKCQIAEATREAESLRTYIAAG